MEEKVKICMLSTFYGKLLTEKQYQFIDDYYNNDLSLSEIAENNNITRQAVRDIIKKGEKKLFEYEEKLEFMKRMLNQEKRIKKALSELTKIQKDYSDKQIATEFIATIQEKALGQDVLKSLTPGQQVIKIVKDELVELLRRNGK